VIINISETVQDRDTVRKLWTGKWLGKCKDGDQKGHTSKAEW